MKNKILLSRYFKNENIVAKEDQLELKPSSKGLVKLKDRLGADDWEMLYIGDGHDDYLAARSANVFFAMIVQGLVGDLDVIKQLKADPEFGGDVFKKGKTRLPKFIVAFTYDELIWWFKEHPEFQKQIKAVCFDLGDTLIVGGRQEAYVLADKNWPTWEVDSMLEQSKVEKKLKEAVLNIRIENKWRKLASLPAMNSSENRISSFFLLNLFDLKEKHLVSILYSEADEDVQKKALEISKKAEIPLNTKTIQKGMTIKELATFFPPEQFSLFIAAGLMQTLEKEKRAPKLEEMAIVIRAAFMWISEYRKNEIEAYRRHCRVPKGLGGFLDLLVKKKKKLCIYSSKSRKLVETAIAYDKDISN